MKNQYGVEIEGVKVWPMCLETGRIDYSTHCDGCDQPVNPSEMATPYSCVDCVGRTDGRCQACGERLDDDLPVPRVVCWDDACEEHAARWLESNREPAE